MWTLALDTDTDADADSIAAGDTEPTSPCPAEDLKLTLAAAGGDASARRLLVERLLSRVRATAAYLAGPDPDLDDFVQNTLVEILRSAGNFRGEGRLEAWADRITVRLVLRQLKKRRRRPEYLMEPVPLEIRAADEDPAEDVPAGHRFENQEAAALRRQLHQRLAVLLQKIKPERRTAVLLRWVHGYGIPEIAAITDSKANTVRGRLRTGKKQLQKLVRCDPVLRRWEEVLLR